MIKKNRTCLYIRKHLCTELDEAINTARCLTIQNHLKNCPECAAYLKQLKKTIQLYRHYPGTKIRRAEENRLLGYIFPSEGKKKLRRTIRKKSESKAKI
jgi:predicted anti-sigma-YlaC factor YlaD